MHRLGSAPRESWVCEQHRVNDLAVERAVFSGIFRFVLMDSWGDGSWIYWNKWWVLWLRDNGREWVLNWNALIDIEASWDVELRIELLSWGLRFGSSVLVDLSLFWRPCSLAFCFPCELLVKCVTLRIMLMSELNFALFPNPIHIRSQKYLVSYG